jgi:PAS domain S-box-containing protein
MFGLVLVLLIETSQQANYIYRIILSSTVLLSAAIGIIVPIAALSLIWLLFIFTITAIVPESKTPLSIYLIQNLVHSAAAYSGWLIFRNHYVASGKESELESELEEEQYKSDAILESITDGVLVINMKNIIQVSNASAAQMLGWTKEEVLNLDFHSLIKPIAEKMDTPETNTELEAISSALATGEVTQKVSRLQTLNGRQMYVDIIASPILKKIVDKEGESQQKLTGVIAVLRDVDQQKRAEQQRSDFISTASHEMRTPVASIQGYLELALNPKISELQPKTKQYLDKAYEATKHLGQLFQDLLTVSQAEDGRLPSHPKPIDVIPILNEICDGQKQYAATKGLSLSCKQADGVGSEKTITPSMHVLADIERLREVIMNLVENAIKYTASGTIEIDAKVKDNSVIISVSDTGPGIAEEDLPHLFQKFYRVDNSATREIGGTGLGLYISKQIIELMDGKIWVRSKLGSGSTFYVQLPRINPEQLLTPPEQPTAQV